MAAETGEFLEVRAPAVDGRLPEQLPGPRLVVDGETDEEATADPPRLGVGEQRSLRDPLELVEVVRCGAMEHPAGSRPAAPGDDHLRDRIGFRTVETDGRDIRLNGEPVTLRGVNRHEDHPDTGATQPLSVQIRDLRILDDAGFNAVRTSHYPNHPRFLDLCDEAGILVIEEIPYWQYGDEDFHRGSVLERGKRMLSEVVDRDRHHPAIFAWSVTIECDNEEAGIRDATAELVDHVREADDSRPVTLASNNDYIGKEDRCFELVDFLCFNGHWGWYDDHKAWDEFLDEILERYGEKPVVISEFGAGAVDGTRGFEDQKWSEGYQTDLLENAVETFEARDEVAGFTIWQYCDTRTDPRKTLSRPKTAALR